MITLDEDTWLSADVHSQPGGRGLRSLQLPAAVLRHVLYLHLSLLYFGQSTFADLLASAAALCMIVMRGGDREMGQI